jgi:hypothetical protein
VTLWQDPLWRHVLCRAVIHYLEANRQGRDAPSFLAVKRLSYSRGRSARGPDYSGLVRTVACRCAEHPELLTWVRIPISAPPELSNLTKELQAHKWRQDAATGRDAK